MCRRTSESLGFISWHSAQMLKIALIPDQHDHDVRIGVIPQLLQPSVNVLVGGMLRDVVNEKGAYSSSIIAIRCLYQDP